MQIFLKVLFIFIFLCPAFLIKYDYSADNKIISGSFCYTAETKQEAVLSVKSEEYFINANNQNKTEIKNQSNKNNHLGLPFGCTIFNQLNVFNKFAVYKDKLSFKYILYRILNDLRNSIYPNAP